MEDDLDALKQQLRLSEKALADAKGRIKAVELDSYETKRNAKLATEAAQALQVETEASLATASEQMRVAHAVACGIYGMCNLSRAFMARKTAAARVLHREAKLGELLQQFVDAVSKQDQSLAKTAVDRAKQALASIKADGESARSKLHEHAIAVGYADFQKVFNGLMEKE